MMVVMPSNSEPPAIVYGTITELPWKKRRKKVLIVKVL